MASGSSPSLPRMAHPQKRRLNGCSAGPLFHWESARLHLPLFAATGGATLTIRGSGFQSATASHHQRKKAASVTFQGRQHSSRRNSQPHSRISADSPIANPDGGNSVAGLPPSSPTKRVLDSFQLPWMPSNLFLRYVSSKHWKNRKKNRFAAGKKFAPGRAIQEEAPNGKREKLGNSDIKNYSCRLRRLGYRRVRLGNLPWGAAGRMRIPSRRFIVRSNLASIGSIPAAVYGVGPFRRSRSPRRLEEMARARAPMFSPSASFAGDEKRERPERKFSARFDPPRNARDSLRRPASWTRSTFYQIHWPPDDKRSRFLERSVAKRLPS